MKRLREGWASGTWRFLSGVVGRACGAVRVDTWAGPSGLAVGGQGIGLDHVQAGGECHAHPEALQNCELDAKIIDMRMERKR